MTSIDWNNEEHRIMVVKHFHDFGMLLTRINGNETNENSYKNPAEEWAVESQTSSFLETRDWKHSTGFGIRLGHNKYRAIDIDGLEAAPWDSSNYYDNEELYRFAEEELIFNCLRLLGLPPAYEWIIKTPHGYHIIFKCDDIDDMPESIAYAPNTLFSKEKGEQIRLSRIELLWDSHLVMAPSLENKYHTGYRFCNCILPHSEPNNINAGKIDNLLNYYCGNLGFANMLNAGYTTFRINGAVVFQSIIKNSICRGSFDEMYEERHYMDGRNDPPTITRGNTSFVQPIIYDFKGLDSNRFWLKACATSETQNKLGILFSQQDPGEASYYFHKSGSELASYNMACLIAMNLIPQLDYNSFSKYLKKAISTEPTYKDKLRILYYKTHAKQHDCLFFSFCTTAKKDEDISSLEEEVEGFPKLIQISWIITDFDGNVQKTCNTYIKPEGYMIPLYVSKHGGLPHDLARYYGDCGYDPGLLSLLYAMTKSTVVVGYDIPFCMKIIQNVIENYNWDTSSVIPEGWKYIEKICLKKSSVPLMKNCYGVEKEPCLRDLYEYLTGNEYNRSKDAFYNVGCIMEIYSILKEKEYEFYTYSEVAPDDLPF